MTFKFFDHIENILGDRKTVQGQSTISSTFAKKNPKSKSPTILSTFTVQSDSPISSPSTESIDSAKNEFMKIHQNQKVDQVKLSEISKRWHCQTQKQLYVSHP